jgi:hypothetical protein
MFNTSPYVSNWSWIFKILKVKVQIVYPFPMVGYLIIAWEVKGKESSRHFFLHVGLTIWLPQIVSFYLFIYLFIYFLQEMAFFSFFQL